MNIALLGYGYWGPNVARNIYSNKNFTFSYICDGDKNRLEKAHNLYGSAVRYTENYDEVLNDKNVEAIAISINTSKHFDSAKKALLAGKHVYVEKPFTSTVSEAKELKELAIKVNKKIHVDHIMIYHPAIRLINEFIKKGDIGDIIYFDCSRLNLGQIRNDMSSMWDLAVHDLSIIDYLTNGSEIEYVKAMGDNVYSKKESLTFLLAKYKKFIASIRSNWISPIKERKMIIAGTKKMIVYDGVNIVNKLIIYDMGFDILNKFEYDQYVVKSRVGDAIIPFYEGGADALYNSLEHFRQCVVENKESLSGPDAAIRVLKVLELADKQIGEKNGV